MNLRIVTQRLQGPAPLDYFIEVLHVGGTPADRVAAELHHGEMYALLPANTSEQRALQFRAGGLLPAEPARAIRGGLIQRVPTSVPTLAKIVSERTRVLDDPVLWIHEPMLTEVELLSFLGDEKIAGNVRFEKIEGELYLAYERRIREEKRIANAIESSMLSWHFLAFVTDGIHVVSSVSALLKQSQMILVGAYDGESALIWERKT